MSKIPTDLQLFEHIYRTYADDFRNFAKDSPDRSAKIYVPIDLAKVAKALDSDAYELFGRLYHHLDRKYGYKQEGGGTVHLFAPFVGEDKHCVNYPLLAAVLAEHRLEDKRNASSFWISLLALGASIVAILVTVAGM